MNVDVHYFHLYYRPLLGTVFYFAMLDTHTHTHTHTHFSQSLTSFTVSQHIIFVYLMKRRNTKATENINFPLYHVVHCHIML